MEAVLFAAKRDDAKVALLSGKLADAVAMETGAVNNPICREVTGGSINRPFAAFAEAVGTGVSDDYSTHIFDIFD